jgi:hypothetical protein
VPQQVAGLIEFQNRRRTALVDGDLRFVLDSDPS